jgi:hypothetical protein
VFLSVSGCQWGFLLIHRCREGASAPNGHTCECPELLIYALSNCYDLQWTCKLFHPCDTY